MTQKKPFFFLPFIAALFLSGCQNSSNDVWENAKTAVRYFNRTGKFWLKGEQQESKQIAASEAFNGPGDEEFIPLKDKDIKHQYAEFVVPQSKESPGDENSPLPGIEGFQKPLAALASVFKNLYFNTDEHVLRSKEYFDFVIKMAEYLKKNPDTYVFVEGHTDERASEAYNLALGTRRANFVRSQLIKNGARPDQVFTTSYGKERPAIAGHGPDAWKKNRRAEFKIFQKRKKLKSSLG